MKGFTGFSHYGHPCFIRQDYEASHQGETELQRLEDAFGIFFSDMDEAMYYCLSHAPYMLYRLESDELDASLCRGRDPWISYKDGYVHIVTGEYVPSPIYPTYDSYPCWKKEEPAWQYLNPYNATRLSGYVGLGALLFEALANIMGGNR